MVIIDRWSSLSCKSGQGEPGASATVFEVQGGENLPRLLDLISFSTQEVGGGYDDDEPDEDEEDDDNDHHEQDGGGDNDNHHNPERN